MKKNNTPDQKNAVLNDLSTSVHTQRLQILAILKNIASVTTIDLRERFGIISPAPRIKELRDMGFIINTIREDIVTIDGRCHPRVARYILVSEPDSANDPTGFK